MKRALLLLTWVVVAAGAAAAGYWAWRQSQVTAFAARPFGSDQAKTVDIPPGSGPRAVVRLLAQAEVVSSADDLYAYLKREKLGPRLKAGEYEFQGPLTPRQVIDKIVSGQVKVYRFTVPEGLRVDEVLPIISGSALKIDLAELQRLAATPSFARRAGVPADHLEGFLFPDTYTFTRGATAEAVLSKMIARALEEHKKATVNAKPGVALDLMQAMTLASIVEKETGAPEERPRISCVFHNRLRLGMKLQTDPTVIYAMMLLRGTYSKNITKRDLETPHPYNTYSVKGLPPGPIANPGAAAMQAALHPLDCTDLYFVSRNDGTHVFCPDLACHEAAVQKWQREYFRQKRAAKR